MHVEYIPIYILHKTHEIFTSGKMIVENILFQHTLYCMSTRHRTISKHSIENSVRSSFEISFGYHRCVWFGVRGCVVCEGVRVVGGVGLGWVGDWGVGERWPHKGQFIWITLNASTSAMSLAMSFRLSFYLTPVLNLF